MKLAAFYHAYANGNWQEPVAEYLQTLKASGFPACPRVGLVGSKANRAQAREALGDCIVEAEADEGFEQVTLAAVHRYAQTHEGTVLYCHTKGASNTGDLGPNSKWRRAMNLRVVDNWRSNLKAMDDHDALGCHWLTPGEHPGTIRTPFFAGNFWMARCDYLARLPECSTEDRMEAELWVGRGNPRVFDCLPGWPGEHRWTD